MALGLDAGLTYPAQRRSNVGENTGRFPDRQISVALITSYGGTSSHWSTKLPLTVHCGSFWGSLGHARYSR